MQGNPDDSHDRAAGATATHRVAKAFEAAWREFGPPTIRFYMRDVPPPQRPAALLELIRIDMVYRAKLGERPSIARYIKQFPRVFHGGMPERQRLDAVVRTLNADPAAAVAGTAPPQPSSQPDGGWQAVSAGAGAVDIPYEPPPTPDDYAPDGADGDVDNHPFNSLQTAPPVEPVGASRSPAPARRGNPVAMIVVVAVLVITAVVGISIVAARRGGTLAATGGGAPVVQPQPATVKPTATRVVEAPQRPAAAFEVDLLKVIEVEADAAGGAWTQAEGAVDSDANEWAMLRIPYAPPEEYDLEVEFERLPGGAGGASTGLVGSARGVGFEWNVWLDPQTCAFWSIDGKGWRDGPADAIGTVAANAGGRHVSRLVVRRDGVEGYLDGVRVAGWKTDFRDLSLPEAEHWGGPVTLGLRTYANPTRFHSVKLIERSGPGRRLRQ